MTAPNTEEPEQTNLTETGGRLRWLVDPQRRGLLLPITGAWILALDWLLFSSNAVSAGLATPFVVVIGFALGAVGTFFFQKRFAEDSAFKAAAKALAAGIVVGVPWPLFGTVVGGWILIVSGLGRAKNEILGK